MLCPGKQSHFLVLVKRRFVCIFVFLWKGRVVCTLLFEHTSAGQDFYFLQENMVCKMEHLCNFSQNSLCFIADYRIMFY